MTKRCNVGVVAGLVLVLLSVSSGGLSQPPSREAPRVVEAETFILRDRQGKRRAELGLHKGQPSLTLFDEKGQPRARLAMLPDGSARLSFQDDKGRVLGSVHVAASGEPQFDFPTSPLPVRPASLETGSARKPPRSVEPLYRQYCVACHGTDGKGARVRTRMPKIPDFTTSKWQQARSDAQLFASILDGRGSDMPPFQTELTREQARSLVAYIRAFGPGSPAPAMAVVDDFEHRLRQLQQQWAELDRQIQALSPKAGKR